MIGGVVLLMSTTAFHPAAAAGGHWLRGPLRSRRPVVAFHADQPYLDQTGLAEPYLPPDGLRSLDGHDAESLAHLVYTI
jgi:hypothetical protein